MIDLCPFCGGILKADGKAYLCSNCSTRFDSKEELDNFKPKKKPAQKQQSGSSNTTGGTTTIIEKEVDRGVDVFESNINSVLEISWVDGKFRHSGSGFLISKEGYAITNTHVVTKESGESCKTVSVKICDENVSAEVLALGDSKHGNGDGIDLALIKLSRVPKLAHPIRFEKDENVRNGAKVFVIGNSLGFGTCITSGIVSDKSRNVNGKMLLMTDCAVNGGNSGGPIFNEKGFVIGAIVSGIASAEGMNFAIPSGAVQNFMKKLSSSTSAELLEVRKALAPCPRCNSWDTTVENGIFHCMNCDFEG